jgi:hypothetical protein
MTQTAESFLASWTHAYAKADPRDRETLARTVEQCVEDAGRIGITREALTLLAGGDLGAHLKKAALA